MTAFIDFLPFCVSQTLHATKDELLIRKPFFEITIKKNSKG